MRTLALITIALVAAGCAKQAPVAAGPATVPAPTEAAAKPAEAAAAAQPAVAVAAGAEKAADHAKDHGKDHAGDHEGSPGCDEPALAVQEQPTGAAAAPAAAIEGKVYGAGVQDATPVTISALLADIDAWVGKKVRVEGMVTDVCQMRGCWFEMAGDAPGTSIRFKVRDGVMVFPMSAKGQHAVAEGVVRKIPLDLETSRRYMAHQAEERGDSFDPSTVTEPVTIVRLDGSGAVLRDKP